MREYYKQIEEPKKYLTIQNSDHYGNTSGITGLFEINTYDKEVIDQIVSVIADWFMSEHVY